jgi:hypothetical protein
MCPTFLSRETTALSLNQRPPNLVLINTVGRQPVLCAHVELGNGYKRHQLQALKIATRSHRVNNSFRLEGDIPIEVHEA